MSDYRDDNSLHQSTSCPFCGSKNIKIIIEKEKEEFDLTSGIIGTICFGPIGLICGLCFADGEKEKRTCICNDCGKRFIDD
ncbi:hypothetical protein [Clostridium sp.]|uniref:hypothetical protein n=1 Tax=Clostridium sp. TaxID=1506 RepID=UPI0029091F35|nr:hypothetical protein [Clostridium sp.]MDU5106041.1 hypothetical protein [Clostridium sp.]